MPEAIFLLLLFLISLLYSSVGHGGASSYIALMTLGNMMLPDSIRSQALLLNTLVSFIAFILYYRQGHFRWKLFYPFILGSIPMAWLGAGISLDAAVYKKILGVLLMFAVLRLLGVIRSSAKEEKEIRILPAILIGACIGFVSGLIGIGGGIILSPVILLLGWANMKETAAVSALFILVNSLTNISSMMQHHTFVFEGMHIAWWLLIALIGALAGSYWGSRLAAIRQLGWVLGVVLLMASFKLIFA